MSNKMNSYKSVASKKLGLALLSRLTSDQKSMNESLNINSECQSNTTPWNFLLNGFLTCLLYPLGLLYTVILLIVFYRESHEAFGSTLCSCAVAP